MLNLRQCLLRSGRNVASTQHSPGIGRCRSAFAHVRNGALGVWNALVALPGERARRRGRRRRSVQILAGGGVYGAESDRAAGGRKYGSAGRVDIGRSTDHWGHRLRGTIERMNQRGELAAAVGTCRRNEGAVGGRGDQIGHLLVVQWTHPRNKSSARRWRQRRSLLESRRRPPTQSVAPPARRVETIDRIDRWGVAKQAVGRRGSGDGEQRMRERNCRMERDSIHNSCPVVGGPERSCARA